MTEEFRDWWPRRQRERRDEMIEKMRRPSPNAQALAKLKAIDELANPVPAVAAATLPDQSAEAESSRETLKVRGRRG